MILSISFLLKNIPFTFERLERYLNNSESGTTNSFLSFMEKRIYERQVTDSTKQRQKCVLKALKEFGRIKDFTDICDENIRAYDEFAKNDANASLRYIIITRY